MSLGVTNIHTFFNAYFGQITAGCGLKGHPCVWSSPHVVSEIKNCFQQYACIVHAHFCTENI